MAKDYYRLKEKSDSDLHDWLCGQNPGTVEYNSGVLESMRRVATLEEALEKIDKPVRKREKIALIIAIITIAITIAAIVLLT